MKNFKTRAITAIFFGATLIGCTIWNEWSFLALFLVIMLISLNEFFGLLKSNNKQPQQFIGLLAAFSLFLTTSLYNLELVGLEVLAANILFFFSVFILELYRKKEQPFENIAYTFLGLFYVAIPLVFYISLAFLNDMHEFNYEPVLGFLFLLWANDTGAYLIGVKFGKNRLLERVSPKKSWEGFFGGVASAVIVAIVVSFYFNCFSMPLWIGMALIIAVLGTMGDLVESLFKRSIDIKDSGSILPGHGGLLDRFDGLFISAPFVYFYLVLVLEL